MLPKSLMNILVSKHITLSGQAIAEDLKKMMDDDPQTPGAGGPDASLPSRS